PGHDPGHHGRDRGDELRHRPRLRLGRQPRRGAHQHADLPAGLPGRLAGPDDHRRGPRHADQPHRHRWERLTMRVTNSSITSMTLANLQASLQRGATLQQQLSSGKRINTASDDPSGTVDALSLQGEIDRNHQYSRNASDGDAWLTTLDTTLTSVNNLLGRARDLVVQASSTGSND